MEFDGCMEGGKRIFMKKIMSISAIMVVGILVLSGMGLAAVNNNIIILANHPPNIPIIKGEKEGKVGKSYTYTFNAEDPDGDNISYYVDWGDGTDSGWTNYFGSGIDVIISHTWNKIDRYPIRCKAKDIHNAESNWSDYQIEISKNKAFYFNFNLLTWIFNQFSRAFLIC